MKTTESGMVEQVSLESGAVRSFFFLNGVANSNSGSLPYQCVATVGPDATQVKKIAYSPLKSFFAKNKKGVLIVRNLVLINTNGTII